MRLEENLSQLFRKRISSSSLSLESSAMSSSATLPSPSGVSMASTGASLQHGALVDRDVSPDQLRKAIRGPQPSIPSYSGAAVVRRKTHWDYLLEEMRWLATDFIEERKWKRCASQTISAAVQLNVNRSASLATKPASRIVADSSERTIKPGESLGSFGESSQDSVRVPNAKDMLLYTDPSLEDLAKAKDIASMVSIMIVGLSAFPPSMGVEQVTSCNGIAKTTTLELSGGQIQSTSLDQGTTLNHSQSSNDPNAMDVSPNKSEAIGSLSGDEFSTLAPLFKEQDASVRETELQRISDYVDSIVSKVDRSNKATHSASTSGIPYTASSGQLAAVACIEDLWLRVSAGAILGGPAHSGKTILSCSFLWKYRNEGPQLVVCSPLSMVRLTNRLSSST
jgi:HSA